VNDILRWATIFLATLSVGTLSALYERIGRFALPKRPLRLIFLSMGMLLVSLIARIAQDIGEPFTYFTILPCSVMVLYLIGLADLYHWYGGKEGRRLRHEMINEYVAREILNNPYYKRLAKAMDHDPDHMGRYVKPPLPTRIWRWITQPKPPNKTP